jgi:uncharacterized iron-regulated membrane protein
VLRLLRRVHQWIGLAIALPTVLVALSGGLLLFRDPYYRAKYPVLERPVTASEESGYADVITAIEARFATPGLRVLRFPRAGFNAFHLYLADGSEALVDPATGSTLARWTWATSAPAFLFDLHAHLLAGATGEIVNGYLALVLVFLGLSGVLLWVPRRRSVFRFRYAVPREATRTAVFRAHGASGVLLVLPVLVFAVTGAGLVFYEQAWEALSAAFDRSTPAAPSAIVRPRPDAKQPWSEILRIATETFPEAGPAMYSPGTPANAVLTFRKSLPGEWHPNGRSYVLIDPYAASVVQAIDAREQGAGTRIVHALYPVHAVKVGGPLFAGAALMAALGLAWLAVGASWSFLGKLLAQPVLPERRTDAALEQGSRADRGDLGPALHAHEPGSLPAALHTDH